MKIKDFEVKNFKGITSLSVKEMPHIAAICGKNGVGKTSFIQALRFAISGDEPDGDVINKDANDMMVKIGLVDATSGSVIRFDRIKEREKPSKCRVAGKTTTQKALNEEIQRATGLELDNLSIITSDEIVGMMKPQEFASLILKYVPEKMTLEKILSFIPEATLGMIDIIDANLPMDGIDITTLDEFDETCRATRKESKASLQAKSLMYDKHIKEAPALNKEDIENRLKELLIVEARKRDFATKEAAYTAALEKKKSTLEKIEAFKKEADKIKATRPNPEDLKEIEAKQEELRNRIQNQKTALSGVKTAIATLTETLSSIESSCCPISPLITCKTDKSVAKKDIEETIEASEESVSAIEKEISKLDAEYFAEKERQNEYMRLASEYERKIGIQKQIKTLEDTLSTFDIEKPEPLPEEDVTAEKSILQQQLANLRDYEEELVLKSEIEKLSVEVSDYESLVKALSDKGPIRTGVVNSYLGVFEEICNERSNSIRPNITFEFKSEKGVVVYMCNTATGTKLTINEVSGGEKAYFLYILLDLLNQLIGARILFMDELEVLDKDVFNTLLDLVLKNSEDYDHVFLAAVNHKEIEDSFKAHEIEFMKL